MYLFNKNLSWYGNLGVLNSICRFQRTGVIEIYQIATKSVYMELFRLCFVLAISRACVFLSQPLFLWPSCRILSLCVYYRTFLYFYFIWCLFTVHLVELSHSSCLTVTQGSCNVSWSFWSRHSTLLFPFELLKTHSRYYVVRNTFLDSFWIISSTKLFHSFSILLHKVSVTFSFASEYIFFWVIVDPF